MAGFGRRYRRHRNTHARKLSFGAIIAICVASALVVSITTGLLLRTFLDEETYLRLTNPESSAPRVENPIETYLPAIAATPFRLTDPTDNLTPKASISVTLNTPDGKLYYVSPVSAYYAFQSVSETDLFTALTALDVATSYISGVFHTQVFLQETADMQYAVAAQERALIREFVRNGGNEILLLGIDLTTDTLSLASSYAKWVKQDIGSSAVGVAVPLSVARSESGWEILGTLLKNADFCALDLRGEAAGTEDMARELLESVSYYLEQYNMRLLISEAQTALIAALEDSGIDDYQIVSLIEQQPEQPEPNE